MLPEAVRKDLQWISEGVALVAPSPGLGAAMQSLLIEDGDVILLDAGLDEARAAALAPHVDVCILTHAHVPHALSAHRFREVWAPREEARALRGLDDYVDVYGVAPRDRASVKTWLAEAGYQAANVTKTYRAGGLIKLDRSEWTLLPAPGHSPGLTLLLDETRHILFASDLEDAPGEPWYGYPACDLDALEKTYRDLAEVDVAILATSRSPPRKRGIRQMFRDLAERVRARERLLLQTLASPKALDEIAQLAPITGAVKSPLAAYHERVMVEKHLARLLEKDFVIARQDGRYERVA